MTIYWSEATLRQEEEIQSEALQLLEQRGLGFVIGFEKRPPCSRVALQPAITFVDDVENKLNHWYSENGYSQHLLDQDGSSSVIVDIPRDLLILVVAADKAINAINDRIIQDNLSIRLKKARSGAGPVRPGSRIEVDSVTGRLREGSTSWQRLWSPSLAP